ncbi:helix-turn-helix transcriptional regulator [Bradyrhizobium sp. 188]|uniref:helix-turn-helix domain-containing protein n=1 Tax=Bradyrhizobium sp. 188 TaxID=2782656 RepID=UPI001FFB83F6
MEEPDGRESPGRGSLTISLAESNHDQMTSSSFEERFPLRDSKAIQALAANLKRLRRERGLTQQQLSAQTGIDQAAISLIENGRSNPTVLMLESLAGTFGVRLVDLLENHPERPRR